MPAAVLGILGGMGPAATADLYRKVIGLTPAKCDQDHIPVVIYSNPQIPDRGHCLEGTGASPLPYLIQSLRVLEDAGVTCVAIACNSAHLWHGEMQASTMLRLLHIADAACASLGRQATQPKAVGLLCMRATLKAELYQHRLRNSGYTCLTPTEREQEELVSKAIYCVKRGEVSKATPLLARAAELLKQRGAEKILLGCTEIPLALESRMRAGATGYLDATLALAEECVAWWQSANIGRSPASVDLPGARGSLRASLAGS
jgi:aspartate racemase